MSVDREMARIDDAERDLADSKVLVLRRLGWTESSAYPDHCWRWSKVFDGKTITANANQAFQLELQLSENR